MNWTLLCQLIVLYFVFSVLGWMMEVTLKYIQYHRFINRGFLIGPYCPIYGSGVVLVTVLLSPACASWDMYSNFEQRGDHFKILVERLGR